MTIQQKQIDLTRGEFIKKFNGLNTQERKELLTKAEATQEQIKEGSDCEASEIVENVNDGTNLIFDCWTVLNENTSANFKIIKSDPKIIKCLQCTHETSYNKKCPGCQIDFEKITNLKMVVLS